MSLKLCVIDDSKVVSSGIANRIAWEQYGIEAVGTATNGEAGLELVRSSKPDIVITDIRMPKKNGIELFRDVLKLGWPCKVILISGYADFEYAQEAVRLGAFDYVSKPFLAEEILSVVLKAKELIEQERREAQRVHKLESRVRESMPLLRQEFVNTLVRVSAVEEQAAKRWDFLQMPLEKAGFVVMAVEIDGIDELTAAGSIQDVELARFALQNILEETVSVKVKCVVARDGLSRFTIILNRTAENAENAENGTDAGSLAELCRENVERYSRMTVSIGVGGEVRAIHELPVSYRQAVTALAYNFFTGGNSVFSFADITGRGGAGLHDSAEAEKELQLCVRAGNAAKALQSLRRIYSGYDVSTGRLEPEPIAASFRRLADTLLAVVTDSGAPETAQLCSDKLRELRSQEPRTMDGWKQVLDQFCGWCCELVVNERSKESELEILSSIAYIRSHLFEPLTVQSLARSACLSVSYYANLFKKHTGSSVAQFIIAERMEQAKSMLLGGKQVQEIAALLGYEDRSYFSDAFKKHTGVTPTEYKQQYMP
jgi:two-component system response regulator YesN